MAATSLSMFEFPKRSQNIDSFVGPFDPPGRLTPPTTQSTFDIFSSSDLQASSPNSPTSQRKDFGEFALDACDTTNPDPPSDDLRNQPESGLEFKIDTALQSDTSRPHSGILNDSYSTNFTEDTLHPSTSSIHAACYNVAAGFDQATKTINSSYILDQNNPLVNSTPFPSSLTSSASRKGSFGVGRQSYSSPSKSVLHPPLQQPQSQSSLKFQHTNKQGLYSLLNSPLNNRPIGTSSPIACGIPMETLIDMEAHYSVATKNATEAADRLVQLLIRYNIVNRLQASVYTLHAALTDRYKSDPSKFSSQYLQAIDFCSATLKQGPTPQEPRFMPLLKPANRKLLNSFLTLVKSSPSFICASLFNMNETEILSFYAPSAVDSFETLTALHRYNALDIIFYDFFPPIAPPSQKFDYFSFIVAFLLDAHLPGERFNKLCCTIIDKFLAYSGTRHFSTLEPMLLGFLQNGQFLLNSSQTTFSTKETAAFDMPLSPLSVRPQGTTSAPSSSYPSPDIPNASLRVMIPSNNAPPPNYLNSSISPSISLHRATARPTISTPSNTPNFGSFTTHLPIEDTELESKRWSFLNNSVSQFLSHFTVSQHAIPDELLHFSSLVLSKVSPKNKNHALHFIFIEYFFKRFLCSFFKSPELYGLGSDFIISEKQRQRILLSIYETCLSYAEQVIYGYSCNSSVPADISTTILAIHDMFSQFITKKETSESTMPHPDMIDGDLLHGIDDSTITESIYCGQLFVLCPSDVLTLYTSLFPSFNMRRPSFPSHSTNPIPVDHFPTSGHMSKSSGSSLGHSYTGSGSSLTGEVNGYRASSLQDSLPSLDEASFFLSSCESGRSTPYFGPKEDPFEWNLQDIRLDIEPVAEELLRKFPYLQFRGSIASQHLNSLRAQKLQSFRLPQPFAEKWQVFCVNDENTVLDVDESDIVDKGMPMASMECEMGQRKSPEEYEVAKGAFQNQTSSIDIDDLPLPAGAKPSVDLVIRAIESYISENSALSGLSHGLTKQRIPNNLYPNFGTKRVTSLPTAVYMNPSRKISGGSHLLPNTIPIPPRFSDSPTYLCDILFGAAEEAVAGQNFLMGSEFYNAAYTLQKLLPPDSSSSYVQSSNELNSYIMKCVKRSKEAKLEVILHKLKKCEELLTPYNTFLNFANSSCEFTLDMLNDLRTKVWYITEVRTTSLWSRARDVACALSRGSQKGDNDYNLTEKMESPRSLSQGFGYRSQTLKRNSSTNSLSSLAAFSSFKRFAGPSKRDYIPKRPSFSSVNTSDGMFARAEYGGKNKLSDRESDATKKWLNGQQIQNFCAGEERIHRFCCEVDDLVKRVIGDVSSGSRNRGQSLLTSSLLFKPDLWKLIIEVEGVERSSAASVNQVYPSRSPFYNFGSSSSINLEQEYDPHARRRSIDSLSGDGFYPSHNRTKTSTSSNSEAWIHTLRGHKSRKSSPNLIDMFASSLDLAGKRMSSEFSSVKGDKPSNPTENPRLRQCVNNDNFNNAASFGTEDTLFGETGFTDEATRLDNEKKREELDQRLLELQMRITSFIYTDIGIDGWFEGEFHLKDTTLI